MMFVDGAVSNLGRDNMKHISCNYIGNEDNCPNECSRCAIAIKTDGDVALSKNQLDSAIRLYKKAVFVEPKFAEAWVNLGNAYGMKSEYNNALSSFDKALAIDPVYGKAMFGKAITLRNLERVAEAAEIADSILNIYPNAHEVISFMTTLGPIPVKPLSLNEAIDQMTETAYNTLKEKSLLAPGGKVVSEKAILCQEDYSARVLRFCSKRYASFGQDKVFSESIITAFYGSLATTLFFYNDKEGFIGIHPFEYLANHSDVEDSETTAERLLGIRGDDAACSNLWDLIYAYARYSCGIIEQMAEQDKFAAAQDATESAYTMGMMYAMKWHERKTNPNGVSNLKDRFAKLIAAVQVSTSNESACSGLRSERIPPRHIAIKLTCNHCRQQVKHMIVGDEELLFDDYQALAKEFSQLGFESSVSFYCNTCAKEKQLVNSFGLPENILFSISSTDGQLTAESRPVHWHYRDIEYRTALSFLNGADSVDALATATQTDYQPEEYIKHIQMVLGCLVDD